MIFNWFFLAFHDISGPGKYGFCCSETQQILKLHFPFLAETNQKFIK